MKLHARGMKLKEIITASNTCEAMNMNLAGFLANSDVTTHAHSDTAGMVQLRDCATDGQIYRTATSTISCPI